MCLHFIDLAIVHWKYTARLFEDDKEDNLAYSYADKHSRKTVGDMIYQYEDDEKNIHDLQDPKDIAREKLKQWDLGQYQNELMEKLGYDHVDDWKDLTLEEVINDVGMKPGHAKRFMKRMEEL